jgi:acetyl esterase/lipase
MQTLDLYLPLDKSVKQPFPVIIWIHGGSWLGGDKNEDCLPCKLYAPKYAVASINYRFTNETVFPGQIHDAKAAVRFLRANAKKYHLDPERIAVWGTSAGGYLAALLGTSGAVKALEGSSGWNKESSRVQAVIDWCGPTNLNTAQSQAGPHNKIRFDTPGSAVYNLMGGRMDKESLASASPVTYASKDDPPFLIMHGELDDAIPPAQSQELYERLKEQGVDASYHLLQGYGHAPGAPEHFKLVEEFLDRALAKPEKQ